MKTVATYTATIYCGLKERDSGRCYSKDDALSICQKYVNDAGLCVTVTETEYVYTNGRERGVIVGLINYPRFPSTPYLIRCHALRLSELLLGGLGQFKVSIVLPGETIMLQRDESPRVVLPQLLSTLEGFMAGDTDQLRLQSARSTAADVTKNMLDGDYFSSPELVDRDEEALRFELAEYGWGVMGGECDCDPQSAEPESGFYLWQFDEYAQPLDDVQDPAENAPLCWFVIARNEHDVRCYIADHSIALIEENGINRVDNTAAWGGADAMVGDGGTVLMESEHARRRWGA